MARSPDAKVKENAKTVDITATPGEQRDNYTDKVAAHHSATLVRKGGTINLANVCRAIQHSELKKLDGVHLAVSSKLKELGAGPNSRAHTVFSTDGGSAPSVNVRSILSFVDSCTKGGKARQVVKEGGEPKDVDDVAVLQCLEAVIARRYANAGYTPDHLKDKKK